MERNKSLNLFDIVLMNVVLVISLRWTASAASNGPSSLLLWAIAALTFFVPEGLTVATLSRRYPQEGGLYRWTQRAFGDSHGFLCGWCYWVNNLLYFPSLLLFVAGNAAFALQGYFPEIQKSKIFVVSITLGVLWLVAILSIVGMRASKWLQNAGAVGNWIPGITVIILGGAALFMYGSANPITWDSVIPKLDNLAQFSFFSQMCFAFAGLELVSFMGSEVKNPTRTIARGIWLSASIILVIYIAGTLAILGAVPQSQITLVNGMLLPIQELGTRWGFGWLSMVCAFFITLGGVGGTMAWFAGAARIPYIVGVDHYLPESFGKLHPRFQTPYVAVLVQTIFATAFTLFATAGASTKMEEAYRLMVDMCLILYFIPYAYLFASMIRLRTLGSMREPVFALVGLTTTVIAILISLFPVNDKNEFDTYLIAKTAIGTLVMLGVGGLLYLKGLVFRSRASTRTSAFAH